MNDSQIISIAITLFAIAVGSIFNNVRISDSASALNKRIDDVKDVLRAEMRPNRVETNARFDRLESKLDTVITMLGHLDTRVTHLEQRQN